MSATDETKRAKKKTPKILLTYISPQPFAERDQEILGKHFAVRSYQFNGKKSVPRMAVLVARTNLNLSWFTLGNATSCVLLSKIFRKKSLVIAGGWDVIYLPEIDYGAMKHPTRIRRTTYALKEADKVIAVSQSTGNEVLNWVEREVEVIYNGVDTEKFIPKDERENLVITVAGINNLVRYKTKGIETFLKAAAKMPDVRFAIIGENSPDWDRKMHGLAADNTTITGRKTSEELIAYYQRGV